WPSESTPCVEQSSAPAFIACTICAVPWNWVHCTLYFLPRLGNCSGRFIIQYFASSAGTVQPTRIVGMVWAAALDMAATVAATAVTNAKAPLLISIILLAPCVAEVKVQCFIFGRRADKPFAFRPGTPIMHETSFILSLK